MQSNPHPSKPRALAGCEGTRHDTTPEEKGRPPPVLLVTDHTGPAMCFTSFHSRYPKVGILVTTPPRLSDFPGTRGCKAHALRVSLRWRDLLASGVSGASSCKKKCLLFLSIYPSVYISAVSHLPISAYLSPIDHLSINHLPAYQSLCPSTCHPPVVYLSAIHLPTVGWDRSGHTHPSGSASQRALTNRPPLAARSLLAAWLTWAGVPCAVLAAVTRHLEQSPADTRTGTVE